MLRSNTGNQTLIFQHIPKTAGTTLSFIIKRYYHENEIYHIRNLQQMRGPAYSRHFGSLDDFKNLLPNQRDRFRCIMGHMPFGIHENMNNPFRYIAFIRDPVNRVVSQFGQHKRMLQAGDLAGDRVSLESFLESKPAVLNNHQTRFLSGWDFTSHTPDECYQKALQNIDTCFSLVGVVERFDESLLLLSKLFCWPRVTYFKRNIGTHRPPADDIDPATMEKIREANQLDLRLHRHVVHLMDEKIRSQGESFGEDLKRFKKRQVLHKKIKQPMNQALHMVSGSFRGLKRRLMSTGRSLNQ